MQHVVNAQVSYEDERLQTVLFDHKNYDWLNKNLDATSDIIATMVALGYLPINLDGHYIFRDIPVNLVFNYLDKYNFHTNNRTLQAKYLKGYIEDQNKYGLLNKWNVVIRGVVGNRKKPRGELKLGPLTVPLLERARRISVKDHAHIGCFNVKK